MGASFAFDTRSDTHSFHSCPAPPQYCVDARPQRRRYTSTTHSLISVYYSARWNFVFGVSEDQRLMCTHDARAHVACAQAVFVEIDKCLGSVKLFCGCNHP